MNSDKSSSSAGAHAHQLVKMRVTSSIQSPTTPLTPQAPETPSFLDLTHFGEENVMEDLQLAAELGKTLLERNRELELSLKQQQAVIDDQLQEIEYLSKQTTALREVNDSRLRIYEQLEVSIQDLEKNNQRLAAEGAADKKKIKSLSSTVESLEVRCDDLQRNLEEARTKVSHDQQQQQHQQPQQQQQQQQQRGRNKRRSLFSDEQSVRRSQSCESTAQTSDDCTLEDYEIRIRLEDLQEKLKTTQEQLASETRKKEEMEIQLACISQEKTVLLDQLAVLQEKDISVRTFDDELASLDDTSSGRICRKCLGHVDELGSNPTLYDLNDSIEDTDASIESIHGECALIRLKNGGYAWGSQESLASIGQVVSHVGSEGTSPGTEASDVPHNSLLSELDTSYRILIEKYEALLEAREQQQQQQQHTIIVEENVSHPVVGDMSGPINIMMTGPATNNTSQPLKCKRCNTCACDLKSNVISNSKGSNLEELSEVETSSSGFSDGESRLMNKGTQTGEDLSMSQADILDDLTPTMHSKCLDLSSPVNPCDKRFQATPEYKKLFQEIFTVLKKTVDEKATQSQSSKPCQTSQKSDIVIETNISLATTSKVKEHSDVELPGRSVTLPEGEENESRKSPQPEEENKNLDNSDFGSKLHEEREVGTLPNHSDTESADCPNSNDKREKHSRSVSDIDQYNVDIRPLRPDTLDLTSGGGSRPSSRQRRRRRQQHMAQVNPSLQQQHHHHQDNNRSLHQTYHARQQHSSHQRHQRRDRDGLHHHSHCNHRQQEDFPDLHSQQEGVPLDGSKTRVVYNSSRGGGRCDHHRSRKHRRSQQENEEQRHSGSDTEFKGRQVTAKINYPSIEVAKLRKLEMTYAEVLKNSMNRSHYHRRY